MTTADRHPGDALDIPTRSTELVRALDQIESGWRPQHQSVELDAAGSRGDDIIVGLTHAFKVPREDGIQGATLKLRLTSGDPRSSNDFILLDRAVSHIATQRRTRIPLIFLRDLLAFSHVQDDAYDFEIDLKSVPVRFLSPGHPSPSRPELFDLTGDLEDGRLNVIVAGESKVDFSDLTIRLLDPPGVVN